MVPARVPDKFWPVPKEVLPRFDLRDSIVASSMNNRGHNKQIFISRSKKEVRANFFTKRVAPVWNGLTQHVVDAPSVDSFKNRLDKFWENHPMKFDYKQSVFSVWYAFTDMFLLLVFNLILCDSHFYF